MSTVDMLAALDLCVEKIRRQVAEGRKIEITIDNETRETIPPNPYYVTREATGAWSLTVSVAPGQYNNIRPSGYDNAQRPDLAGSTLDYPPNK